jgi:hypothetical protein
VALVRASEPNAQGTSFGYWHSAIGLKRRVEAWPGFTAIMPHAAQRQIRLLNMKIIFI